jgi:hypothetical protein
MKIITFILLIAVSFFMSLYSASFSNGSQPIYYAFRHEPVAQLGNAAPQGRIKSPSENRTMQRGYPNPFGPSGISVRYTLAETCLVDYKIYSIDGAVVEEAAEGFTTPGLHVICWYNADRFPSGIYFMRITACDSSWAQRIVLQK